MTEKMIVATVVLWAALYSIRRLAAFVKEAGSKDVKCSCSSCPYLKGK